MREQKIYSIHGKITSSRREGVLKSFLNKDAAVLLATDVIARGIDFGSRRIDCVFQYDAPQYTDFYVHRIGRTARMGAKGQAVVLLTPEEHKFLGILYW